MKTSLKTGFAQIFSCCPKKYELPKLWGGGGCSPPRPPGPYAYGLICSGLHAQCIISKSNIKLCIVRRCVCVIRCNVFGLHLSRKAAHCFNFWWLSSDIFNIKLLSGGNSLHYLPLKWLLQVITVSNFCFTAAGGNGNTDRNYKRNV